MNKGYLVYADAFERTCERLISRVFDEVAVTTSMDGYGYPILRVTVKITRNKKRIEWNEHVELYMLTPEMYADYFRDRLPEKIAHMFTDFLLRG